MFVENFIQGSIRSHRRSLKPVGLLAFLVCSLGLSAQQPAGRARPASSSIDLNVVVASKSGAPVGGLQQKDFTVLDNKTRQPITSFRASGGSQAPIHVIIVFDAVNVPYESIAYSRGQVEKYLRANGGRLSYPTELAFFLDNGVQIAKSFSTDGNELSSSLSQYNFPLRDIRRSSQFQASDRFNISINGLSSLVSNEAKLPGRKLILWVSPGWPLLSGPLVYLDAKQQTQIFSTVVALSNAMRTAGITLYNVNPIGAAEGVGRSFYYQDFLKGVSKPGQVAVGDLSLQVLAVHSGGLALYGNNNLVGLLEKCVADGQAYYELSFAPPTAEHRDEYHNIEVHVADPGLTARTIDGYYAQP